ncbi:MULTISPECIES: hypothetical protein [unclassified Aureispira]|uniref:hypothetical protein n=1 Tax=unclassified Aureispira TaxID=2649989 RepID=UPI0012DC9020|nr:MULTISPECIES: hypothetical protein [unclassified Aureispira]WMX14842.1 hypothetical protein QP953_00490 [Aureispira sp. CCB-E]
MVILSYGIGKQDSLIRFRKTMQYDTLGRLMQKQNYYYHIRDNGRLTKEEKAFFDLDKQVLTEEIIDYPEGKEPLRQKLITRYLDYQAKEEDSKYILRQLYDKFGELAKEDTLTYDEQQNLTELCSYNYTGSTSLSCNYYTYKDSLKTRWTTYAKWNTINIKGDVVERSGKRRDYRYKYNKKGQLTHTCGKYYKNRFRQKIKYDKQGHIVEDKTILRRKIKQVGSKDKPPKKKYRINKEEHILTYKDGRLISDIKSINKKEINKKEVTYENEHIKTVRKTINGALLEEVIYSYNKDWKIIEKTSNRYTKKGKIHYRTISYFDEKENLIREEQNMGGKILSITSFVYDSLGNLIEKSLSSHNNKSLEKTLYIYKYY